MAQYPEIRVTMYRLPDSGDVMKFFIGPHTITLTATSNRVAGFGEYVIASTIEQTVYHIYVALFTSRGAPFKFLNNLGNHFTIICERYDFGDFTWQLDNSSRFSVSRKKVSAPRSFEITGFLYEPAFYEPKCLFTKTTALIKNGTAPYDFTAFYNGSVKSSKIGVQENDLYTEIPRNSVGARYIEVKDANNNVFRKVIPLFERITSLDINVAYDDFGATVSINPVLTRGNRITPLQYSLDNINFQSSNNFYVFVSGDFTAYVVDKYGCLFSTKFTVDLEERKGAPYFDIEITNPLRLVDQNITGIKNISNQLAANYDIPNVEDRFFRQPFKIGDIIRTQFKSNYSDHEVRVYNCGNLIETITPVLKIENTNRLDKRDVVIRTGSPNKTNVAFPQGNIYDPITNDVIDTYFQFDGRLPSFVRVGMLLTFNEPNALTGTFEVEEIIFDERLQSWVAVITATILGHETAVQVLSTYNLEEYNIYEFELTYPEGQYHIEVVATDDNALYPDVLWESEPFFFSDDIEVVTIDYSSNVNQSLIDYRTDIEFRLCVPGRFAKYQPTTESETFKDDLGNLYLQKNTYNRMWEVETSLIPWWLAEKLIIASKHKILKIDGISVVNSETPEVTDRLGERNPFYQVIGMYQENIDISVTDETGIISGARGILGGNENQVIGI